MQNNLQYATTTSCCGTETWRARRVEHTHLLFYMQRRERVLYHQIHPLKLLTDVATAALATALLWRHHLLLALIVGFLPSLVISAVLLRWADLEPYRRSAAGRYIARFMTRRVELARLVGLLPLWGGAWIQRAAVIAFGIAWIGGCWLWGLRAPMSHDPAA